MEHCCAAHDRLDLVRETKDYTAPECGSLGRLTNKPDYCCFNCPTLVSLHKALHDSRPQA
jgi:hypothetical protein